MLNFGQFRLRPISTSANSISANFGFGAAGASNTTKKKDPSGFEGKAAWVSRQARRLNELEADIAKLQAHLIQKRRDLQVEIQELDVLRAQLASPPCKSWKNMSYLFFENWWLRTCRQIWKLPGQNVRESGMNCARFRSPWPTRNNV